MVHHAETPAGRRALVRSSNANAYRPYRCQRGEPPTPTFAARVVCFLSIRVMLFRLASSDSS
jgi:hypothetical protein